MFSALNPVSMVINEVLKVLYIPYYLALIGQLQVSDLVDRQNAPVFAKRCGFTNYGQYVA